MDAVPQEPSVFKKSEKVERKNYNTLYATQLKMDTRDLFHLFHICLRAGRFHSLLENNNLCY